MSDLVERARDPRNQFLFDPPVAHIATALLKELAAALEAAEREREAMRAALKTLRPFFGHHMDCCNSSDVCDCGLDAALSALQRDEPPAKEGL